MKKRLLKNNLKIIHFLFVCLFFIVTFISTNKNNMKNLAIHTAINSKASMLKMIGEVPVSLIKLNSVKIKQAKKLQ